MKKNFKNVKNIKRSSNWKSPLRIANFSMIFAIIGVLFLVFSQAATVAGFYGSVEQDQAKRIWDARAANGKGSLHHIECLNALAEGWAKKMADAGNISHNPNLANEVSYACGNSWSILGENVGVGYDSPSLFNAFMASPGHKANILDGRFTKLGVGAYYTSDGRLWVTQMFAKCVSCTGNWQNNAVTATDPTAQSTKASAGTGYYLKNSNSSGVADIVFGYGIATDQVLFCDWDGNGTDTIAVYRDTKFYIRNSNVSGVAEITFGYGGAGDIAICGDWNGDGVETIGIYRPNESTFYLRNSNTGGGAEIVAHYGTSGDKPIIGDWDGNGTDTIGITRGTSFYLRNSNTGGGADIAFGFGGSGDLPIVGDWDGNGTTTIGVYRPSSSTFYLRNSNTSGGVNITAGYGGQGDKPVVGDWDGNKTTTIGIRR